MASIAFVAALMFIELVLYRCCVVIEYHQGSMANETVNPGFLKHRSKALA